MRNIHKQKKIGILTFPTVINHGAYLQVFALYNTLMDYGHEVEVINYRNKDHLKNELKSLFIKKHIPSIFINIFRYIKFYKAQKRLSMQKLQIDINSLNTDKYDIIIVGADIVWNYETPYVGHDPIYFGEGINNKILISYAASMGNSDISKGIPNYVKNGIKSFSYVSVRDNNSKKIAEKLGVLAELVLDPCLIFDYKNHEILPNINYNYILIYAFDFKETDIKDIIDFANKNSLKIISIGFNKKYNWCDKNLMILDPLEFLGYYKKASFIFTSTFHGVLFSIKYKRNFAVRMNFTIERKVMTILEDLNLTKQVITDSCIYCWDNEIDYDFSSKIMSKKIDSSIKFLINSINDA